MQSFSMLLKQCRPARHAVSQQQHDNLRRISVPESDGVLCGAALMMTPPILRKAFCLDGCHAECIPLPCFQSLLLPCFQSLENTMQPYRR